VASSWIAAALFTDLLMAIKQVEDLLLLLHADHLLRRHLMPWWRTCILSI